MKEIIPLKKEFVFKTKIGQITNIGLDFDYKIKDDLVEGFVDISGNYKMLETSVTEEDFFYSIPFSIAISNKIKKDTIKIEVDDFNYKVNKDVLSTSIDLCLECEESEEIIVNEDKKIEEYFSDIDTNEVKIENEVKEVKEIEEENDVKEINNDITTNITNNIFETENKYCTYKIYIVRKDDTIETICNKYNVSVNDIKEYNDITNINVGDKIIIPQINE